MSAVVGRWDRRFVMWVSTDFVIVGGLDIVVRVESLDIALSSGDGMVEMVEVCFVGNVEVCGWLAEL